MDDQMDDQMDPKLYAVCEDLSILKFIISFRIQFKDGSHQSHRF